MNKFESFLAPNLGVLNIEKTREIETLNRNRKWKLIAMQNLWIRLCSKRKKETDCNINIISWTNEFVRILRSQYFKKKSSYQFQFFVFFWNSINARPTNTPMKYRLFSTLLQKKLQAYPCSVSRPKKTINLKGCAMNDKSFKLL